MNLKLNTIIEELAVVRNKIADKKEELAPLEEQEEKLRETLVNEMHAKSVKTWNSDITNELYTISETFSFKVIDEEKAQAYAYNQDAMRIDLTKLKKILRTPNAPMPEDVGFEPVVTESLRINKRNDKEDI